MPAALSQEVRKQVIQQWISGDTRNKIAIDNGIGEGTVSDIIHGWKNDLKDSAYESVRELAVQATRHGLTLSHLASHYRLYNFIRKLGVKEDQLELFIANFHSTNEGDELPPEKIVDIVNQLFDISTSESIPLEQVPEHIQQKLQEKQKLEQEINAAEAILQSKNVSIEAINEHIHLNQELEKHGLDIHDTYRLMNLLANTKQYEFEPKRIVAKLSGIRQLEKRERVLRNNCLFFAKRLDKYKEIIPLAEKIVAMKIGISELLALDAAVTERSEQYNLPIPAAAFRLFNDIKDHTRMGGLKKTVGGIVRANMCCK